MKRANGFYWVVIESEDKDYSTGQLVAEFKGYGWTIPGMLFVFDDDEVTVLSGPIPPPDQSAASPHS
ncbi:MAG: hypothetical protein K0R61_136 [Microvirga sp.]|jgi:hypothetical protein|nr:hypothetical protein [Microvirga sp.]